MMKKLTLVLLLIQSGFMMAQTETKTFVTVYGEKVKMNPNPVGTADNGLMVTDKNVQLGGDLIKKTSIGTTDAFTLAIKGLQTGTADNNIIVADASGVLKWVDKSVLTSSNNIKLINSNYTVEDTDYTIVASKLSGDITVTLPDAASSKGRVLVINQADVLTDSGNEITVKFNVNVIYSDSFSKNELAAPFYSATGGTLKITLQSDGVNWYVVSSL